MNAALMSFVSKWMGDYDKDKEKKDNRSYNEKMRDEERVYEESQKKENRKYQEDKLAAAKKEDNIRELESAAYNSRVPIKANSWDKFQETGQAFSPTADDMLYRPAIAQAMQSANLQLQASPIESKQRYSIVTKQAADEFKTVRDVIAKDFTGTNEQGSVLYPDRSAVGAMQANTALEGLQQGLPKDRVNTERAALNLSRQTANRGGREPWQAVNDRLSVIQNPTTGGYTIRENTLAPNDNALSGMISGNNALSGIAQQLGMEKYPWEQDSSGNIIQRKRPATATPSAQRQPIVPEQPTGLFTGEPMTVFEAAQGATESLGDKVLNVIDNTKPALIKLGNTVEGYLRVAKSPFHKQPLIDWENWKAQGGEQAELRAITEGERARQLKEVGGNTVINPFTGYPYTEEEAREPITSPNLKAYRRTIGR